MSSRVVPRDNIGLVASAMHAFDSALPFNLGR